jgi:hypothetical protein
MSTLLRVALPPSVEDDNPASVWESATMDRSRDLFRQPAQRLAVHLMVSSQEPEELLVADPRGSLSPAQMVEEKLVCLLRGRMLPLSHIQSAGAPGTRLRPTQR